MFVSLILGCGYGYVAFEGMAALNSSSANAVGVAIFVGMVAAGAHVAGFQYGNDSYPNRRKAVR
jgi:hypothetical protein